MDEWNDAADTSARTARESQRLSATQLPTTGRRPHVVIVGAGFGGLAATRALARAPVDVTLIDRRNYHLFQPLLYQVATAGLSPADIAWPIRSIVNRQDNVTVLMATLQGIDAANRTIATSEGDVDYDYLVLATGARHAYFGRDDWETYAHGLKSLRDATGMRRRVLTAFERAETETDDAARRRLMTIVLVGGGPTGVEMAGALAELVHRALARDFRRIDPAAARIVLVESSDRLLTSLPPPLSGYAARKLARMGVELRLGQRVTACDADGVTVGGIGPGAAERIESATVIWTAGVAATPAGGWLGVDTDRAGRIVVAPDYSLPGHAEIFAIGDLAAAVDDKGRPIPGIAPAAKQQGRYVARVIAARAGGKPAPTFRYRNYGNLATIGRNAAVIDFGFVRLSGWLAWWVWGVVHIYFLIGVRAPLLVAAQWLWSYLTFGKGARLITGGERAP